MSYVKQGFTSGQTLKAEHLNYIEDGIEAASSSGGGSKVIILEAAEAKYDPENYFYNGENVDGNFLLDCLLSGYQIVIKDVVGGEYLSVYNWHTANYGDGSELYLKTDNGTFSPRFEITITEE
jgi:hypothetical protein